MRTFPSARRNTLIAAIGAAALIGTACTTAEAVTPVGEGPVAAAAVTPLPANGQFDYQIGGAYTPLSTVAVVDRDRNDPPLKGKYNICYVNAFQTQPSEASFWTDSHGDLLVKNSRGGYLIDPEWPDEYILDTSTAAKRTAIAGIVNGWIDGCATAGYQAIEPDNLDSWTRSANKLTQANNVALATLLATHAHSKGLAIAQKNTAELGSSGKTAVKFDFAIAEECQVYAEDDECGEYTRVYGNNVIEIEYTDNENARALFTDACRARGNSISVILRDRDVVPKGNSAYAYEYC